MTKETELLFALANAYLDDREIKVIRSSIWDAPHYSGSSRVIYCPHDHGDLSPVELWWYVLLSKYSHKKAYSKLCQCIVLEYGASQTTVNLMILAWYLTYGRWLHIQKFGSPVVDIDAFRDALFIHAPENLEDVFEKGPF